MTATEPVGTPAARIAQAAIEACLAAQQGLLDAERMDAILAAAAAISAAVDRGNKILLFGNGGSAGDAAHMATELVGRFMVERRAVPAVSLSGETATLTAIANDYGFERVFARQIEALGLPQDVAVAISTSGRSANVLAGVRAARERGLVTIGLTGEEGGALAGSVDICLRAPSDHTPRVQEVHTLVIHILCELVERGLR